MNIKPTASNLSADIRTHKEDEPIRAVVNNTQAPSYKAAKFLNKKLQNLIYLPDTHTTKNSHEIAQELNNIQINEDNRIITLDIKGLYVNLPIKYILLITEFWLNKCNQDCVTTEQTLHLLEVIQKQNYFQYHNQFFQPNKGIAMGSPISGTLAEIYLIFLEETYEKHCLKNKEITYYKRYVDNILIIFNQNKISANTVLNIINNADEHLEFKMSKEENGNINYLDLSIQRNTNNVELSIYRKPTYVDITIHFSSNHPYDQKLAAFNYYINRMLTMPITEQAAKQEWNRILIMAQNNGFREHIIHRLKKKLMAKKDTTTQTHIRKNTTNNGPLLHIILP
jgi:hypothetical protein